MLLRNPEHLVMKELNHDGLRKPPFGYKAN